MAKIYNFQQKKNEDKPEMTGVVKCLACDAEWQGVSVIGCVDGLECPNCKCFRGVFKYSLEPRAEANVWQCECKNNLFFVFPGGLIQCCKCGMVTCDHQGTEPPPPLRSG